MSCNTNTHFSVIWFTCMTHSLLTWLNFWPVAWPVKWHVHWRMTHSLMHHIFTDASHIHQRHDLQPHSFTGDNCLWYDTAWLICLCAMTCAITRDMTYIPVPWLIALWHDSLPRDMTDSIHGQWARSDAWVWHECDKNVTCVSMSVKCETNQSMSVTRHTHTWERSQSMSVTRHIHTHINECDKSVDRPQAMQEYSPDLGLAVYFDFLIGIPTKVAQIQIVYGFYEVSVRIWLALFRFFSLSGSASRSRARSLLQSLSLSFLSSSVLSILTLTPHSPSFSLSLSLFPSFSLSLSLSLSFSLSLFRSAHTYTNI